MEPECKFWPELSTLAHNWISWIPGNTYLNPWSHFIVKIPGETSKVRRTLVSNLKCTKDVFLETLIQSSFLGWKDDAGRVISLSARLTTSKRWWMDQSLRSLALSNNPHLDEYIVYTRVTTYWLRTQLQFFAASEITMEQLVVWIKQWQ